MADLITDEELLSLGIAADALGRVPVGDRNVARAVGSSFALSFLRKRFTLPLVSWSDDVKRATAHVVSYDLLVRRGFSPIVGADASLESRYMSAVQWLRDVARGIVEPESVVDSTPVVDEAGPLTVTSDTQWRPYGQRR